MYSLNVPIPGQVKRFAADLHPDLFEFDTVRDQHTLVVKRFGDATRAEYIALEQRARRVVRGTPAFEVRIAGIDYFDQPARGEGPVVYLAVDSPGLRSLHQRLVDEFDAIPDIEGDDYVPHITLARGGNHEAARRLAERQFEPLSWTVTSLQFWDATYDEPISTVSLPA